MPRTHNGKGRSRSGPPFTQLFHYMQDSPAWRALSMPARAAWLEVARLYNGSNNGRLALSVADLSERLGKSDATAWRALKELLAAGFIEVVRQGYWKPVAELRVATEYRLTCYRCDVTGELPSRAFQKKSAVSKRGADGFTHETKRHHDTAGGFTHETKTAPNGQGPGFTSEMHVDIYHGGRGR